MVEVTNQKDRHCVKEDRRCYRSHRLGERVSFIVPCIHLSKHCRAENDFSQEWAVKYEQNDHQVFLLPLECLYIVTALNNIRKLPDESNNRHKQVCEHYKHEWKHCNNVEVSDICNFLPVLSVQHHAHHHGEVQYSKQQYVLVNTKQWDLRLFVLQQLFKSLFQVAHEQHHRASQVEG